ncbi:ABC transporter ATP-binding protein [Pseudonocardia asaccharolytica]|uniref:Multidrug ABC transporter permease n=1 Tax=Pseudonocardia asaccharolytica DSM 44247 = NBRC 16224 TaxID=1123024 RepID=A0A511D7P0_9PSEU|nr:ABC transporter ATP-binding protein [Pseudonocardia asaccharolytica]GEL20829.1 multidrug ABC transporter permease [Pseudonocardia asaccharolytica DSM 44247 = NBRC 16224]
MTEPPASGAQRDILPIASARRTRAVLGELLRPCRVTATAALGALAASAAVSLLTAPLLGRIVDLVVQGGTPDAVTGPVLVLVAVALGQGVAAVLGIAGIARVGESMLATLRERFVAHALGLPLERVEAAGSGDLSSRVTSDVTLVGEAVREAVPEFARAALVVALTLVGLAVLDWRFLLAALLAVPIQALTARWYLRRSAPLYAEQRVIGGAQHQQLLDTVSGAATVRAFGLAAEHRERVRRRSEDVVTAALRVVRLQTGFFGRLNLAEFVGAAAVLATGFVLVRAGAVSVGTATAAALYFINLFNPINQVLFLLDTAQSAAASVARIVGVADLPAEHQPERPARPVDASVRAKELGHRYVAGHDVLDRVNLDVADGEQVVLVGGSGAGKTTLAKLVAGVHRPSRGSVDIGGVQLSEQGPAVLRETIALITQEVHVFAGPLADDLRLARPDATEGELLAALQTVGAREWAESLPAGLDTVVGTGGHPLTVVQAQQIALARLVLADPPLAILDEATAEAGSAGSRVLEAAARRALAGRTALVVAHRLTQAASADRVVVLEAGRVVEQGSHDELVAAGGRYARLWAAWQDAR